MVTILGAGKTWDSGLYMDMTKYMWDNEGGVKGWWHQRCRFDGNSGGGMCMNMESQRHDYKGRSDIAVTMVPLTVVM